MIIIGEKISIIAKKVREALQKLDPKPLQELAAAQAKAGAHFIVAPGFNPAMVAYAISRGATVVPGVVTPSEIEAAISMGLRVLKFFPAQVSGGPAYLSAVRATYPTVRFMPTGGINVGNLGSYLALPNVIAAGGTWIATADAIRDRRWCRAEPRKAASFRRCAARTDWRCRPMSR